MARSDSILGQFQETARCRDANSFVSICQHYQQSALLGLAPSESEKRFPVQLERGFGKFFETSIHSHSPGGGATTLQFCALHSRGLGFKVQRKERYRHAPCSPMRFLRERYATLSGKARGYIRLRIGLYSPTNLAYE